MSSREVTIQMKKLMITGALLGFGLGLLLGLVQGSSWPSIIWRSSVACFVSGILLRWWGKVWMDCWQKSIFEKMAAAEEAERQAKPQTN